MSTAPVGRVLDTRALVEPVDRAAVLAHQRDLKRRSRAARSPGSRSIGSRVLGGVLVTAFLAVLLAIAGVVLGAGFVLLSAALTSVGIGTPVAGTLLAVGTVAIVALIAGGTRRSSARAHERTYRLHRFAMANGFDFEARVDDPERPSEAFGLGILRIARDVVRTRGPHAVEVATYSYSAGSKSSEPFAWTYLMATLDHPLPHVVVETLPARGAPGARAPRGLDRTWDLALDGPSGDRHRAYGPVGSSQRDARALFPRDFVELLVRAPLPLSAEVTGDRLFLFSERPLDLLDPAVWDRLLGTADDLAARLTRAQGPGRPGSAPSDR